MALIRRSMLNPFAGLGEWSDLMGGMLYDFPRLHEPHPFFGSETEVAWHPSVDMYEDDDKLYVKLDLPGMNKEDIDISFDGHVLSIMGRREEEKETGDGVCYWSRERRSGEFHRYVHIPIEVSGDDLKAKFENGVLTVSFNKAEKIKRKKIEIESGGTTS
ncbi:MAG: Hsp20/alpha crystallin family protein [Candidatus Abyssubacteria bacterium]